MGSHVDGADDRPNGSPVATNPIMHVVLYEPDIPQNTGTIARLCLATGSTLHLVGRLGFRLTDAKLKRAGLDYWRHAKVERHVDLPTCLESLAGLPVYYFSAHAEKRYTQARFAPQSVLVFGSETRGLPAELLERNKDACWTIPILDPRVRSLNLAVSVGVVLYEAIRQNDCPGAKSHV